jgi:hypothetical protein
LTAKVAPNPASDEVQIEYALENVSENTNNDAVSVVLILVDAAGREAYRKELGKRTVQTLHRETLVLPHLASASYLLLLETPREVLRARVDVVR